MEVRKICQWCGKPFIAQKTTTCYCSHQCSNLGYKERIRERKRQLKRSQELLQPRQAAEGQDFFSFAQAAKLMGVTRQYIYKLVKESKLRASRISGKKSLIRRADIELMMKTKPYERVVPKEDFDISEYCTAEEIAEKFPGIENVCENLRKYEYSDHTFQIVAPRKIKDILEEGEELQHCIIGKDTYFARMVKQESYLLFLRKKNAPQKPYYTLEVEPDGTVRQKRTYFNRQNPDIKQAEKFLLRWQKQLSRKLNKEDKMLSIKSRDLRKREIEDLREKKVKVNGFGFTGKLLADILEEDLMENAA